MLPVDLGVKDLVHDPQDASDRRDVRTPQAAHEQEGKQRDSSAGQMGFVKRKRVDRPRCQGKLVERKAPKSATHILLPVAADELGNLWSEAGVNLVVAARRRRPESRRP